MGSGGFMVASLSLASEVRLMVSGGLFMVAPVDMLVVSGACLLLVSGWIGMGGGTLLLDVLQADGT